MVIILFTTQQHMHVQLIWWVRNRTCLHRLHTLVEAEVEIHSLPQRRKASRTKTNAANINSRWMTSTQPFYTALLEYYYRSARSQQNVQITFVYQINLK